MKGVLIEKTGGVEVLQYKTDLPVPTPKEDEILVRNEVCGVNFIDTYVLLRFTLFFVGCLVYIDIVILRLLYMLPSTRE